MQKPEDLDQIPYPDEAFNTWGASALGVDPLEASFTSKPYAPVRPHVPFYRFLAYPDILDLRKAGYEIDRFIPLFDQLEDVRYRQALALSAMLHFPDPEMPWNPRRAREIELEVRSVLHEYGLGDLPTLLRKFLGRAFPGDTVSYLSVDLINVFFWAVLAELADDLAWRDPSLSWKAQYLRFPLNLLF
ncbi:MAG: hypothetical protein RLZZ579_386 [Actinomycetota bacterium]